MYREFYHLTRKPFEMSIDPHFYYPTPQHNEAVATLSYGVRMKRGFVVLTGEAGTGKTLVVRSLLDSFTGSRIAFAFLYNPILSVKDFLAQITVDLGLRPGARSKGEMLFQLNRFLLARSSRMDAAALIVDEAHLLGWSLLEEIRLLTNLETSQHKLLQIVLVGQPELDRKLDSYELRQLKQRVGLRCQLQPLGKEDVRGYIRQRLALAGAPSHGERFFPDNAIDVVREFSRGIPRLINTLCENALTSGFARQELQISPEIVREAAVDLRLDPASELTQRLGSPDPVPKGGATDGEPCNTASIDVGCGLPS
jgi:general secretion pathway protein A